MKLSPIVYYIIALSVGVIALSWAFFHKWQPQEKDAAFQKTYADNLETEANKMPLAVKRVEDAKNRVNEIAMKWQAVVAQKTPPMGSIDLSRNRWQLTIDAHGFRDYCQRALNAQLRYGGIKVIQGPRIPEPSDSAANIVETYFNYPARPFPVCMWDLGQVTVTGTFEQIVKNVEGWSQMPNFLAVADGLQLQGTSPTLTATYNLSIAAFIRGKQISPPVPEGAAPSGGGPNIPSGGGTGGGGGRQTGPAPAGPRPGGPPPGMPSGNSGAAGAGQATEIRN